MFTIFRSCKFKKKFIQFVILVSKIYLDNHFILFNDSNDFLKNAKKNIIYRYIYLQPSV